MFGSQLGQGYSKATGKAVPKLASLHMLRWQGEATISAPPKECVSISGFESGVGQFFSSEQRRVSSLSLTGMFLIYYIEQPGRHQTSQRHFASSGLHPYTLNPEAQSSLSRK